MQKESNLRCSLFFVSNCLIYQYLALIIPDLMLICCTRMPTVEISGGQGMNPAVSGAKI